MIWQARLYYLIATIILAYVDKVRIKATWGKQKNISKKWSIAFGVIAGIIVFLWLNQWSLHFSWNYLFLLECIAIRAMFYDPVLNLFRREKIDFVSSSTNSGADKNERKFFKSFWHEKETYAGVELVLIIIQYLV